MKSKKSIIALIIFIVLVGGLITSFILFVIINEKNKKEIPDVIGKDEITAVETLEAAGFIVEVEYLYSKYYDKGKVAKLAKSLEIKENGWHAQWLDVGSKHNYKKTLYVVISKGPSGYNGFTKDINVSVDGLSSASWRYSLLSIDYTNKETSYYYLTIEKLEPKATFYDSGKALFESDITTKFECDYTCQINNNGKPRIKIVFPVESFGAELPKHLKYSIECSTNGTKNTLTIEYKNIVWEKNGYDFI